MNPFLAIGQIVGSLIGGVSADWRGFDGLLIATFGLLFATLYWLVFLAMGRASWRLGLLFGLGHALFAGTTLVTYGLP